MDDATKTDTASDGKPLASLASAEKKIDPPAPQIAPSAAPAPFVSSNKTDPEPVSEPVTAADRLRAFEDEHLGKDAVRIGGRIERGSGSPYQNPKVMTPELRRQHAALEKVIESEQTLADAHTKLLQAEADHEANLAATEPRPDAVE